MPKEICACEDAANVNRRAANPIVFPAILMPQPEAIIEPSRSRAPCAGETEFFNGRADSAWFPVTYLLNNLNRGLGLSDAYPFVLSTPVLDKLEFVHDTIATAKVPVQLCTP